MAQRYFTVDEANRTLPLVRRVVRDIVDDYARWKQHVRDYEVLAASEESEESAEQVGTRAEIETLAERIDGYIAELTAIGCLFKGFEEGLVDFYAKMNGQDVLLCWRLGEAAVEHWHEIEAGFGGRQPLVSQPVAGDST
jgi:hypothetical protein